MVTPSNETALKILNSAAQLFYKNGIRATGVDAIIARAGVAKMSFYKYYPGKHDLILAYFRKQEGDFFAWLEERVVKPPANTEPCVVQVFSLVCKLSENPEFRGCSFINALAEGEDRCEEEKRACRSHKHKMREIFIRLAKYDGLSEVEKLSDELMILFEGACVRSMFERSPDSARTAKAMAQKTVSQWQNAWPIYSDPLQIRTSAEGTQHPQGLQ